MFLFNLSSLSVWNYMPQLCANAFTDWPEKRDLKEKIRSTK